MSIEKDMDFAKAMNYASSLAMSLWKKYYQKESPNFGLCDSLAGVLTQIDNMTCGLEKIGTTKPAIDALLKAKSDQAEIIDQLTQDLATAQAEIERISKLEVGVLDALNEEMCTENDSLKAEIARLRGTITACMDMTDADNPDSYRSDDREGALDAVYSASKEALSQSSPSLALHEYRDMKQIAHLIGSIFFAGDFIAETVNERELEALLIKNGFRYRSWEQIIAASPTNTKGYA
jgi:hypothetical protein